MFKNLAHGLWSVSLICALPASALAQTAGPRISAGSNAAAAVGASPAARPASPSVPLKIAFVYVSPIGDSGWTFQHDLGRREMEAALGPAVKTTVVESVAEGPDSERVIRDLAAQGNRLVFATSFGYLEPALRVAPSFPNTVFEHAGGYKTAANVGTYNARYYEGRYLAGIVAARASKSHVAGYVAGFPVPEVVQGINAFTLGMRSVDAKAQVRVVWLNTWFDPAREREAAQSLVNQGADVLTNHSGSSAVAQTAEQLGVKLIAYTSDMRQVAPHAQLTSVMHQWGGFYTTVARNVAAGTWTPTPIWGGLKDGFITLAPFSAEVSADSTRLVAEKQRAIERGSFQPFSGRIVDNTGVQRQASGTMSDGAISTMNYLVEGVVGSVGSSMAAR